MTEQEKSCGTCKFWSINTLAIGQTAHRCRWPFEMPFWDTGRNCLDRDDRTEAEDGVDCSAFELRDDLASPAPTVAPPALTDEMVEAALDTWFSGADWRSVLDSDYYRKFMRETLEAVLKKEPTR